MRGSFGEGDSHGNDVVIRRLGWRSVGFYYFQGGGGIWRYLVLGLVLFEAEVSLIPFLPGLTRS